MKTINTKILIFLIALSTGCNQENENITRNNEVQRSNSSTTYVSVTNAKNLVILHDDNTAQYEFVDINNHKRVSYYKFFRLSNNDDPSQNTILFIDHKDDIGLTKENFLSSDEEIFEVAKTKIKLFFIERGSRLISYEGDAVFEQQ